MKYFLLSIFSSALLLFGFSYLYGLAGTTNLPAHRTRPWPDSRDGSLPGLALVALVMVVGRPGLPHHGGAVPLLRPRRVPGHDDRRRPRCWRSSPRWPASPRCSACSASCRSCLTAGRRAARAGVRPGPRRAGADAAVDPGRGDDDAGQRAGLLQDNLKRLLAYSSVAHAGYMLIGLAVAPQAGRHGRRDGRRRRGGAVLPRGLRRHDGRRLRACLPTSSTPRAAGRDGGRPGRPEPQPSGHRRC